MNMKALTVLAIVLIPAASHAEPRLKQCRAEVRACEDLLDRCTTKLVLCQAFPASGQTSCWDTSGTLVPCAATGHDGDHRAGAKLSYVDNGDGTLTDAATGLMWEKKSSDGGLHHVVRMYTWADAFAVHIATLNSTKFAGYADWRLPNVKELQSLVDYERNNPSVAPALNTECVDGCTVLTCSCTRGSGFWTSTTLAPGVSGARTSAWMVEFVTGAIVPDRKTTDSLVVRAVRGGL